MKLKTQASAALLGILLTTGLATATVAQGTSARDDRRAEMFAMLDANEDGQISAEEFAARPDRFDRVDTNGDGRLTLAEITALGEDRAERRAERMMARLDTNGDGAVSRDEIEARRDPARMFDRLDANDDGVVSEEEFADARFGHRKGGKGHWSR